MKKLELSQVTDTYDCAFPEYNKKFPKNENKNTIVLVAIIFLSILFNMSCYYFGNVQGFIEGVNASQKRMAEQNELIDILKRNAK